MHTHAHSERAHVQTSHNKKTDQTDLILQTDADFYIVI